MIQRCFHQELFHPKRQKKFSFYCNQSYLHMAEIKNVDFTFHNINIILLTKFRVTDRPKSTNSMIPIQWTQDFSNGCQLKAELFKYFTSIKRN